MIEKKSPPKNLKTEKSSGSKTGFVGAHPFPNKDLQKWIRIRKELYQHIQKQVRHRLGEDTPELDKYLKIYQTEFDKGWRAANSEDLWTQIDCSNVVLMGDFHALHQSQKAQLRILRGMNKHRKIILAVEFFDASDQAKLDAFLNGKISENDFLKAVQWQKRWGFPWEHYRPLLRWAQKHKVQVVGINKSYKKRNATTLKSRDVFSGKRIADLVRAHEDALIFVIYGDLHLAKAHIPKEIIKHLGPAFEKKILRLFQNSEKIYFQLLRKELEAATDLVRISQNTFCLMSVPPWVKWQNYLMYLEQTYDAGLVPEKNQSKKIAGINQKNKDFVGDLENGEVEVDYDYDDDADKDNDNYDDEELSDYTEHVGRYVKIISEELGCPVSISKLAVYTTRDSSFWVQVREKYDLKKMKWIESLIADEVSFYLPEIEAAYLARATVNHAAALAMQYIHVQLSGSSRLLNDFPKDFLRLIWVEAVSYFGSKIINHKRKTDTIADIKSSLASRGPTDIGKEAMQLALAQKMHELMVITGMPRHRLRFQPKKKWSYCVAASLLGGMIGERLYSGYHSNILKLVTINSFLRKPLDSENFEVVYYSLLEVIEAVPVAFHSKKEKL